MQIDKERLLKITSDSVMIIFSVLLALFLNEWRSNYNDRQHKNLLIKSIEEEIIENQEFVLELIPYHESIREKINQTFRNDSLEKTFFSNPIFQIYKVAPEGIIQGQFSDLAWSVAKQDKITSKLSFELAQSLYAVYNQQQTVNKTIGRIIGFISSRETQRKELLQESIIVFGTDIHELAEQEKTLNYYYEKALEELAK